MAQLNRLKRLFSILFLFSSFSAFAQTDTSIVKFSNPATVATPKGYSHAAVVDLGTCHLLVLSGQVPLDSKGNLVGKDNLAMQTEQVFQNIKNILAEFGGTMDHIIKIGVFMVDVSQIQTFRNSRDKYISVNNPPASTLVEVSQLFREDVLIEVEATAIIPKK